MHLRLDNARGNPRVEVGWSDAISTACSQAARAKPPAANRADDGLGAELALLRDLGGSEQGFSHRWASLGKVGPLWVMGERDADGGGRSVRSALSDRTAGGA